MSTQQAKTSDDLKRQVRRFWIMSFAFPVAIPIALMLTYYGYCFGWWGRNSLLLQHLFQCKCPVGSEQARYPDEVVVIISACRKSYVELSPSGRFLSVHEEPAGLTSTYLLDLQTMESIEVTNQPNSSFLTDDIGFIESGLEDYLVDRTTGMQYPIQPFEYWRENAYVKGEPNLELLVSALRQAERVILTPNYSTVVVLMPNLFANPERSFTFDQLDFPNWGPRQIEQFLQENDIVYQAIFPWYPHEVVSPDGRLIARDDGIYLAGTDQFIVNAPTALVRGWTSDGSAAIYSPGVHGGLCLIHTFVPFADDVGCTTWVPQPVLLLKVPEEYLSSTATP